MSVLAIAAAALSAVSTGVQALSEYRQGQYEKGAASAEAQAYRMQAKYAQQQAGVEISAQDIAAEHQLAANRATIAASGIVSEEGSPQFVATASADEQRIIDMYTKYSANIKSASFYNQAALTQSQGEQAATAGELGAFTTVLGGASDIASSFAGKPKFNFTTSPTFGPWSTSGGGFGNP